MKKPVLLATHMGSGSTELMHVLTENPRVQCYRTNQTYQNPEDLIYLTEKPHKCNTRAAVYMDELCYNHQIRGKWVLDACKFVYAVREPLPTLNHIIATRILQPDAALRYYRYRMRRMFEMARKTPGAVFLTWDDISSGRGNSLLEEYLHLKEPLPVKPEHYEKGNHSRGPYSETQIRSVDRAYEGYVAKFHRLDLRRVGKH